MKKRRKKGKPLSRLAEWDVFEQELREIIGTEYRDEQGKLIKKAGEFPTEAVLKSIGKYDLAKTISRYHGGYPATRKRFGFPALQRPPGFWKDFSNVERELREIIDREVTDSLGKIIKPRGEFPSMSALQAVRRWSLVGAIARYHGGMDEVRRRMGFPPVSHLRGYWKDWEKVERELRSLIERETRDEAGKIEKRVGEFPLGAVIRAFGEKGLLNGIHTYHGGLSAARRRMGFKDGSRPPRYWKDFKDLEAQLRGIIADELRDEDGKVMKAEGEFPSAGMLSRIGQSALVGAMRRHGGIHAVRKRMGFESTKWRVGYWRQLENVKTELRKIIGSELRDRNGNPIKKAGEFPTEAILKEQGLTGMVAAIQQHHGGMPTVRRAMGFELAKYSPGRWRDLSSIDRELRAVIEAELTDADGKTVKAAGEFPTHSHLLKAGRGDLESALSRHGGIASFRDRLGFPPSRSPDDDLTKFENLERKLREVIAGELRGKDDALIKRPGDFPTAGRLKAAGRHDLLSAMSRHFGGMSTVRERMGFKPSRRHHGYWKEFANVEGKLIEIMESDCRDADGNLLRVRGTFPGPKELMRTGNSSLLAAINRHHGGMVAVRARIEITPIKGDRGYWKEFANVEKELIQIIRNEQRNEQDNVAKEAGEFPTYGELLRMGRGDLLSAMQVHHGGHRAVKAKMGFSPDMPEEAVSAFVRKLRTVEGAEELARCPDLSAVDKADVLVAQNRDVFLSPAYVEYALRKLEDMPSFSPYVEGEPWRRGQYQTHEHFDQLVRRRPDLFARPELLALLIRKLENVYFRRFHDAPQETLAELRQRGQDAGLLAEAYAEVNGNLRKMQLLRIPDAVRRIRNPHWFDGSGLEQMVLFPSLHQKRGILRILEQKRVLIADEMGTGKTAQAILANLLLAERLGKKIRTLVICPSSVISWWREKIDEYCENVSAKDVVILAGGGWRRGAIERAQEGAEFVLINYDLLSRQEGAGRPSLVGELAAMGLDYVVVDEVHHAKNMNANRAEAIQRITERVPYVALLSGTPIPNRLRDIGMTMSLLEPDRYPTARHFRVAYGNNPRLIRDALINGRMLRVRSTDVFELPQLRFREETVRLIPEQRDAYLAIYRDKRLSIYGKMALLRLVLLDPNTVPRYVTHRPLTSPKYEALDRILEEKVDAGEKAVVFTCFKHGITRQVAGRYARYNAVLIDGDVDHKPRVRQESQRELIRREFQFGESQVLIATIGTMSEGVDLTAASTVVFLDKPFTSTGRDQAIKRVHRLGQTRPVEVVSLVARDPVIAEEIRDRETGDHGTLDEALERLIEKKEQLIEQVVDGARLSEEEKKLLEEKEILGRVLFRIG